MIKSKKHCMTTYSTVLIPQSFQSTRIMYLYDDKYLKIMVLCKGFRLACPSTYILTIPQCVYYDNEIY